SLLVQLSTAELFSPVRATHAPRFLLLYGSLRERSYSRFIAEEAARLLQAPGGETRLFNPSGLPLVDDVSEDHPKVRELHELVQSAEGMAWSSPERHGAMTGLMKTQIDWIPLSVGAVRLSHGQTLAVPQVLGASQSEHAVNHMRVLARLVRMLSISNQSFVAKASPVLDDAGRIYPSPYYDR